MLVLKKIYAWFAFLRRRTLSVSSLAVLFALGLGLSFAIASCSPQSMVAEQQQIADTFYKLKLIPKPVKVEDIVWKPS